MAEKSRHWVPAKQLDFTFPYEYQISIITEEEYDISKSLGTIDYFQGNNLKEMIREKSLRYFPFYDYLDMYNYNEEKLYEYKMIFEVAIWSYIVDEKGKNKAVRVDENRQYVMLHSFKSKFRFTLIDSLDKLKEHIEGAEFLAFDTETTGLNPEEDKLVGISFSKEFYKGYYVPIGHSEMYSEYNLGKDAVDIVYNSIIKSKACYMFNARFDMRVLEFYDENFKKDYKTTLYDMSKANIIDAQINAYFADPGYPDHTLKHLEKLFLGYHRPDLKDTLKSSGVETFNTALIDPKNILFYAAQDAISTYELANRTHEYYEEFGISGQIDQMILFKLMRMENNYIDIDVDYLEKELKDINERLRELEDRIRADIGDVNLNSTKQKIALFESFGLDTGKKTKTGNMATGRDDIEELIKKLEEKGKKYPSWLGLLNERAKLEKLQSSFFGSLLAQAKLHGGRIRINYRHGNTSTGRFSSGEEKES